MKKLNSQSTAIFGSLLLQMGQRKSVVLESTQGPGLLIQIYKDHLLTPKGPGSIYQLSLSDPEEPERKVPEMLFIVVDNRQSPTDLENLIIWPQRYANDRQGVYLESIFYKEDKLYIPIPALYEATLQMGEKWLLSLDSKEYIR